jgi:DNA-binding GntR family transcriptional regulator
MSGNKVLVRQLRQLFEHIYLRHRLELMNPARISVAPEEHMQIFEYIREKNFAAAAELIKTHIRKAKESILLIYKVKEEEEISFQS